MVFEPRWIVSASASCLHAAAILLDDRTLADRRLAEALSDEVAGLGADLETVGLARRLFFEHAVALCVQFERSAAWAEVLVAKTLGTVAAADRIATRLASRLDGLEAAFMRTYPRAIEELELRSAPLREQWEARGAGLLSSVARLVGKDAVVDEADVILVQPVCGGGGAPHVLYNSVRIEAVLANPLAELPEVARLGWLIAQLNLELPRFAENLPPGRLAEIGPLAFIPPVLAAAQDVELARLEESTVATAARAWAGREVDPARLLTWWETFQDSNPSWAVALGALARMLVER